MTTRFTKKIIIGLAVLVLATAVIHLKHRHRVLFTELEQLRASRDALNNEWGKLLLEEGAWSQQRRIEKIAKSKLDMAIPQYNQIVVVNAETE